MRIKLALALSILAGTPSLAADRVHGVVELFTSQGCSSCPPADALIEKLARQRGLAILSLPVDYWDRLGWKDTFGSPAHSARQRGYATARGDRAVYTPQAVINGTAHMNGADRGEIEASLDRLSANLKVSIDASQTGDTLRIDVGGAPAAATAQPATLVLLTYLDHREVAIGRGENARRRVTYTNIVRSIDTIGSWTGEARTIARPLSSAAGADGAFVLLQTGTPEAPGPIIGAAQIAFAK